MRRDLERALLRPPAVEKEDKRKGNGVLTPELGFKRITVQKLIPLTDWDLARGSQKVRGMRVSIKVFLILINGHPEWISRLGIHLRGPTFARLLSSDAGLKPGSHFGRSPKGATIII